MFEQHKPRYCTRGIADEPFPEHWDGKKLFAVDSMTSMTLMLMEEY